MKVVTIGKRFQPSNWPNSIDTKSLKSSSPSTWWTLTASCSKCKKPWRPNIQNTRISSGKSNQSLLQAWPKLLKHTTPGKICKIHLVTSTSSLAQFAKTSMATSASSNWETSASCGAKAIPLKKQVNYLKTCKMVTNQLLLVMTRILSLICLRCWTLLLRWSFSRKLSIWQSRENTQTTTSSNWKKSTTTSPKTS